MPTRLLQENKGTERRCKHFPPLLEKLEHNIIVTTEDYK
jgi:hypothetical protein